MKSQFLLAFNEICRDKNLPPETIIDALKTALVSAYRRNSSVSSSQSVSADIDPRTGELAIFAEKEVSDSVIDNRTEVLLDEARRLYPDAQIGDMVMAESTPKNFGRIAAQTAKQVILQRVREAERDHLFDEFSGREGEIVNGTVQSVSGGNITIGLGRTEAVLPRGQQVPRERYKAHDKIRCYILEVRRSNRGPQIIVSRSHRNLLRRLLELEVPEIYNGQVDIKSIAREAGARSKVAVQAMQPGVDPVGACVGMRGVRIQSIVRELNDEKIDVIEFDPDPKNFIAKALSPARVSQVFLDDDPIDGRTATVIVPDDQLSLAIGREGQNARLAAKLTGWRIDIKSLTEAGRDSLNLLGDPAADAAIVENTELHEKVLAVIAKKEAARPITAEDYGYINRLVVGVEGRVIAARAAANDAIRNKQSEARLRVPEPFWTMDLEELDLPLSIHNLLSANKYKNPGDVTYQVEMGAEKLLKLEGFTEESLAKVKERIDNLKAETADLVIEPLADTQEVVEETPVDEPEIEAVTPVEIPEDISAEIDTQAFIDAVENDIAVPAEVASILDVDEDEVAAIEEAQRQAEQEELAPIDDLSKPLVSVVKEDPKPERKSTPQIRVARGTNEPTTDDDARGKQRKDRQLVFDEDAGRVLAKRKRKKSRKRTSWDNYDEDL